MNAKPYSKESFRTADSIGYLLKMAHSLMISSAEEIFQDNDISFMQWVAMQKIRENAVVTSGDLCRATHYDSGAMTRMIDQLVAAGYVVRERSERDRRVVQLTLTSAGVDKLDQMLPIVVDNLNAYCDEFDDEEFAMLVSLLKRMIGRICKVSGRPLPEALR